MALGVSLVQAGQPSLACQHFEQSLAVYDLEQHLPLAFRYGLEIGATANAYWAWSLWLLGYPDQALERSRQTLALLEQVKHPYTESARPVLERRPPSRSGGNGRSWMSARRAR